jgi:signal transduction histidine kinase
MNFVRQLFSGLRFRLFLLVLLTCAPLVALMVHTAGEERRRQVTTWQQRCERLGQVLQREEDDILGSTRQLLLAVAESTAVRTSNQKNCKKLLDELFASYPRYANLGVLTTNGDPWTSALPLDQPANQSTQRFFTRAVETGAFSVGDFPTGENSIDRPTLKFGYPVLGRSDQLSGVVFAALDLHWFNHFGSEIPAQMPKAATWIEIDPKGFILTRYPAPEGWIGRQLADKHLLELAAKQMKGIIETRDDEGVSTFYAYSRIPSRIIPQGVITILGIPKQALFAQADRTLSRNLAWLGLAAVLALTLGWFGSRLLILRPVEALVRSSARLALGELSARTGLPHGRDELGRLTLSFDQMAEALEERERERQRASTKLHVLSNRLVEVQESERRHIARELHDEIGQTLTSAEMHLQAALRTPGAGSVIEHRLEESIHAVERVLDQVHDLSLSLRPSMLDDLGLGPALRWYTQRQAELAGLHAQFCAESFDERIDPMIETGCFRVAQEALTNVLRHAKAQTVAVDLRQRDGHLHLVVRDDGIGFDVSALRERAVRGASLGLLSMEERATLAGGGIEYTSSRGQGTEVHAWFPLIWRSPEITSTHE